MSLKLYHNPISTCSQKVRLVLAEKGVAYDTHVIEWARHDHLSDWYLAINPNGVVPTLTVDGAPVLDSSVICEYLDEVYPEPSLGPRDALGRAEMRAWMRYFEEVPTTAIRVPSFNGAFLKAFQAMGRDAFTAMANKLPLRKQFYLQFGENGCSEQMYQDSIDRLRSTLERVSNRLGDGRPWLLGANYSIADIVLVPSIIRMVDLRLTALWDDLPLIGQWLSRVEARPSFAKAYLPGSRLDPDIYWKRSIEDTDSLSDRA